MNAAILSSGNELMTGEVIDGNSAYLAEQLTALNVTVQCQLTVGDNKQELVWAIRQAAAKVELVIITGGLGPTEDDLTRCALAEVTGVELLEDQALVNEIAGFFRRRGRPMKDINRRQAQLPRQAKGLSNPVGTAPGICMTVGNATVFALPGVPREMREMFANHVRQWIYKQTRRKACRIQLHCTGMGESDIADALADVIAPAALPDGVTFGTRAREGIISLKLSGPGQDVVSRVAERVRARLGSAVFGEGDETLGGVVGRLLKDRRQTLAVAESCTGGYVSKQITDVAGSSEYFLGGWVCYSNAYKQRFLGVPQEILDEHGAVSEPCAQAMLNGLLDISSATWGIAITGIAGPGGGTADKPVGLVYVAVGTSGDRQVKAYRFADVGREAVRYRAAVTGLNRLRLRLIA